MGADKRLGTTQGQVVGNVPTEQRRNKLIVEKRHDTYLPTRRYASPSLCGTCGLVYVDGRWIRDDEHEYSGQSQTCPACLRTADNYPAGVVELAGSFVRDHASELLSLARAEEAAESAEHPLERLMTIVHKGRRIQLETTGTHLPRRIGNAVRRAYEGDLNIEQPEGEHFVRVHWSRD